MKRIILFALSCILLSSCSIFAGMSQEEKDALAANVQNAIAEQNFKIDVSVIQPFSGPVIHTQGEYSLEVKDGKANSYLPFFGESHNASYGGTESGIKFKDYPVELAIQNVGTRKGETIIAFNAKSFNDVWRVVVQIWDNGKASISCTTREKTPMTFTGDLVFKEN